MIFFLPHVYLVSKEYISSKGGQVPVKKVSTNCTIRQKD